MGFLKNLIIGGSTPKKDGDKILCGDCREEVQPDARRCPNCNAKIFTWRGRTVRRLSFLLGIGLVGGIEGALSLVVGLGLIALSVYYYIKRPIHYLKPPHRPPRQ